jgi:hypothetical protein
MIALVLLSSVIVGCDSSGASGPRGEEIGRREARIHGGSPDTIHQAVVAMSGDLTLCTATIFNTSGDKGFALTAAHCCRGMLPETLKILVGDDYTKSSVAFDVSHIQWDRRYDGKTHDFCVVTFSGPAAEIQSLPSIPLMAPTEDALATGDGLELVGFGTALEPTINTQRRSIFLTIESADALTVGYNQADGGPCYGDSGGPGLAIEGGSGEPRLAAIISRGDDDCTSSGVSGRVSAVHDDFILPSLAGEEPVVTCGDCSKAAVSPVGDCAAPVHACLNDPDCSELVQCYGECGAKPCLDDCTSQHAAGLSKYLPIKTCICDDACSGGCEGDGFCSALNDGLAPGGSGEEPAVEEGEPASAGLTDMTNSADGASSCATSGRPGWVVSNVKLGGLLLSAAVILLRRRMLKLKNRSLSWNSIHALK